MHRREMIVDKKAPGGYWVGRRGEDGKVHEKQPNYYP